MTLHTTLRVIIISIPHKEQRYNTVGDWWHDPDGTLHVRVSRMHDWRFEVLVAIHELVECLLCRQMNISQDQVDEFDLAYEARRPKGDVSEAGDDPHAPYRDQHCIATGIERIVACMLGVSWREYENTINAL